MKPRYTMALGMFAVVVLAGAVSAGIFLLQGAQAAIYAQLGVLPLLVLVVYVWVNRTVRASGTSRTEFERRKARQVGEQFVDGWGLAQQMTDRYDACVTGAEWDRLQRHASDLESAGISVDTNTGSFDVDTRNLGSLEELNRLEGEVDELEGWLLTQCSENVRDRVESVNATLSRLDELVGNPETVSRSSVPDADPSDRRSWQEVANRLEECYREADRTIEAGCTAIQEAVTSTEDVDSGRVEQLLSDARAAADTRQYDQAVTSLLDARDAVEYDASAAFDDRRALLSDLLSTATRRASNQHVDPARREEIETLQAELDGLDDAFEVAQLHSLQDRTREACLELVGALADDLDQRLQRLDQADVPRDWYDRPEAVDTDFVSGLQQTDDDREFNRRFEEATDALLAALDEVRPKVTVVKGFDRVESQITGQLRAEGQVSGDDIPVSEYVEQFLGLYYRRHMGEIEFDPDDPSLRATDGTESYDVTVRAVFPEGGSERELTVELVGQRTWQEVCHTPLVAVATFEDIPYGEYTVRVEPREPLFSVVERTVTVDSEMTVELNLERRSLRDQLCEGVDVDAEGMLPTLAPRFRNRFEDEQYLSTSMSFPVDAEYIPCLLAIWAGRQDHDVIRRDGEVVVYDGDQLRKELENVVRYNLDFGGQLTYDELRQNFLSAPIPDGDIEELLDESTESGDVRLDDTGIQKTESAQ